MELCDLCLDHFYLPRASYIAIMQSGLGTVCHIGAFSLLSYQHYHFGTPQQKCDLFPELEGEGLIIAAPDLLKLMRGLSEKRFLQVL